MLITKYNYTKLRKVKLNVNQSRPKLQSHVSTLNIFLKKIYIVNSSQFSSPNALWSRNVHRQPPDRRVIIYLLRFIAVASIKQSKTNKV